jgi:pSer/pThr/pTyr-binding forkhead associated (FHA) protein
VGRGRQRRLRLPVAPPANGAAATEEARSGDVAMVRSGAVLQIKDAAGGRTFPLPHQPVTIGCDPECEIVLRDEAVAPAHARIWFRDGRFLFHRLDRPREVKVSGRPLDWAVLESGDVITIGPFQLVFQEPATAQAATAANAPAS